jgi:hypothetical protein
MRGNSHVRFGKRDGRNRALKGVYDAPVPTSRVAEPSQADQRLTRRLSEALGLIDVRVLDHFVIGDHAAVSFAQRGMI